MHTIIELNTPGIISVDELTISLSKSYGKKVIVDFFPRYNGPLRITFVAGTFEYQSASCVVEVAEALTLEGVSVVLGGFTSVTFKKADYEDADEWQVATSVKDVTLPYV